MKRICLIALLAGAAIGCPDVSTQPAIQADRNRDEVSNSPAVAPALAEEDADQAGYWDRVTTLYENAKASGETTAASARDWISELSDSAKSSGVTAASDTTEWVGALYERARDAGETSAGSAKDWVMDDIQQMGSWQYKSLEVRQADSAEIVAQLNKLGSERWECFWVDRQEGSTTFYLKKPGRSYLRHLPSKELIRLLPLLGGGSGSAE